MTAKTFSRWSRVNGPAPAFTLIELLVVIAIIGILAALIFPAAGAIKRKAIITRTQTEMDQIIVAIDLYKEKLGSYPPDNPVVIGPGQRSYATNQLFYELGGTKLIGRAYETLDGIEKQLTVGDLSSGFGGVAGIVNCTKGGEEGVTARNFLKALRPAQTGWITNNGVPLRLLTCSVTWSSGPFETINPWRYNSSSPTNSPGSYDLWVDVLIGGKTNRISNWRRQPLPVATP